jgi:peptidoglycan/LPS O-acetylase OafA/YrhL
LSGTDTGRLHGLDILRGLLALSVAVYHLSVWSQLSEAGTRANNLIAIFGNYGVEGFFVVSGFCFFHLYGEARWGLRELRRFHFKRFFRIAPLYYLAVLLNLVLRQPVGPEPTLRMLAENLTLSFGLFHPNHALVLGGWSIGIEYVFYLAFPLLAWATRRKVFLYLGAALFVALALPWSFGKVQAAAHMGDMKFHAYVQIPNHAFLFLLGGIIADLRKRTAWRLSLPWFLGAMGFLLLLLWPRGPVFYDHFEIMAGMARAKYVGICVLAVAVFAFYEMPDHVLRRPFTFLGDASYSVYLLHPFAWLLVTRTMPKDGAPSLMFLAGMGLTLGFAAIVYRWIEKPAMALGRRLA